MKRYLLILCVFVLLSCRKEQGCTDQIAINFNSTAEEDDGSCIYSFVGGYWITQSITTEGSITTSAGSTIVSDSSFNFTETNPDSLSPYRIDFFNNNTFFEFDISNDTVDTGDWSVNGNQLTIDHGDTSSTLLIQSLERDNTVLIENVSETSSFMGLTISYNITRTFNSRRQF